MTRPLTPAALILSALLAGCDRPAGEGDGAPANMASGADNGTVMANMAENAAEPARSILRPDVVEEPEPPKIEPAHAVVGFGANPMALDDTAKAALDMLMETPALRGGGQIVLRGHSDSRGSDGDNRVASRIRAEMVRDYLVSHGVAEGRVTVIALGETRPVAPNAKEDGSDDPEGRARNRRVDVEVAAPPEPATPPPVVPTLPKED
ncbi:OOP family OmpA-OmpF porin [Sphingobium sp. OAS761]|uniref:OmpA family protein n=1 Tax=Sphingobium sp. OAS761 TaxID=2817901 RepID=UPI0020A21E0C|nr:OmpA family protein [Sphingobium sp. OAS761]MCP1469998.1 OOP family OmpA-OmpF porin [Sphingobium sp. OAS761]